MKPTTWTHIWAIWLVTAMTSGLFFGCSRTVTENKTTAAPASSNTVHDDGSSSGGGSFGDESSFRILRWAADDLADQILNSSPELYKNLPQGWSKERLAEVIRKVEPTQQDRETYTVPEISRYGERL